MSYKIKFKVNHKFLKWTHCELLKEYLVGKIVSANFMSPPQLYCYFCFHVDFHVLGDYCCWHLLMLSGEDVAHLQKRRNNKKGCKCQTYLTTMQKKGLRILVQIHNVTHYLQLKYKVAKMRKHASQWFYILKNKWKLKY